MMRTIGTIQGTTGETLSLRHNDQTGELRAYNDAHNSWPIPDWTDNQNWRKARRAAQSLYHTKTALHDSWVLCLRPVKALETCTSETR